VTGKFVYVLSSSETDYFAEMTAISLASLRLTNPKAQATLIIDSATRKQNRAIIHRIVDSFDDIVAVEIQKNDQVFFSRYMKVKIRDLVSGDFLYIDSDTIILKDLSQIFGFEYEIGGALDISSRNSHISIPSDQAENFRRLNWNIVNNPYVNGGVFYMKDSENNKKFSDMWFKLWNEFGQVIGKYNDQPSFNYALDQSDSKFHLLPQTWNAQVGLSPLDAKNAKIAHVYSGQFETRRDTVLHLASHRLKAEGVIDFELLEGAIRNGHVWTSLDTVKKNVAMGRYGAAAGIAFKKLVSG
jgi:lipopolysaccharide biosynthesis glycosyltransferase